MKFDLKYALITNYLMYAILILYPIIQLFGTNDLINLIILIVAVVGVQLIISKTFGQRYFKQHPECSSQSNVHVSRQLQHNRWGSYFVGPRFVFTASKW